MLSERFADGERLTTLLGRLAAVRLALDHARLLLAWTDAPHTAAVGDALHGLSAWLDATTADVRRATAWALAEAYGTTGRPSAPTMWSRGGIRGLVRGAGLNVVNSWRGLTAVPVLTLRVATGRPPPPGEIADIAVGTASGVGDLMPVVSVVRNVGLASGAVGAWWHGNPYDIGATGEAFGLRQGDQAVTAAGFLIPAGAAARPVYRAASAASSVGTASGPVGVGMASAAAPAVPVPTPTRHVQAIAVPVGARGAVAPDPARAGVYLASREGRWSQRRWSQLHDDERRALRDAGLVDGKGLPIAHR